MGSWIWVCLIFSKGGIINNFPPSSRSEVSSTAKKSNKFHPVLFPSASAILAAKRSLGLLWLKPPSAMSTSSTDTSTLSLSSHDISLLIAVEQLQLPSAVETSGSGLPPPPVRILLLCSTHSSLFFFIAVSIINTFPRRIASSERRV